MLAAESQGRCGVALCCIPVAGVFLWASGGAWERAVGGSGDRGLSTCSPARLWVLPWNASGVLAGSTRCHVGTSTLNYTGSFKEEKRGISPARAAKSPGSKPS